MSDVMGISEQLKKKLIAGGYTDGRVIDSGCIISKNPVRDMHLGGGKKKITQKVIDNYIKGISTDYECELQTFDKSDDFCVYVKLKDKIHQSLIEDDDCEPTEEECEEICEPEAVISNRRIIEINVHKDCLVDVLSQLTKYTRVHRINIEDFCANYYELHYEFVEEV